MIFLTTDFLVFLNIKMSKNFKRNTQKIPEEAKSCLEEPSRKTKSLEYARQKIFKLLTNPVNKNYPEFVVLNKKAIFESLNGKLSNEIKDFEKQGFVFYV